MNNEQLPSDQINSNSQNTETANTQQDSVSVNPQGLPPAQVQVSTLPKKSKKLLIFCIVVLLVAAGITTYFIKLRTKPASLTTPQANTSNVLSTTVGSFYIRHDVSENDNFSHSLELLDTENNKLLGKISYGTKLLIKIVKNGDKTGRFYFQNEPGSIVISYEEDGAAPKTLYELKTTEKDYGDIWTNFDGKTDSNDTTGLDLLEIKKDKSTIKHVDISGRVEVLATLDTSEENSTAAWGIEGFTKRHIIPSHRSPDGKTIYFNVLNCVQCDGGGVADIVTLDTVTKKFKRIYAQPGQGQGSWTRIDDDHFLIHHSDIPALGFPSYTDAKKYFTHIYRFNTKTKTAEKLFESDQTNSDATTKGYSYEKDMIYVEVTTLVKGNLLVADRPQDGYESKYEFKELRSYTLKDGKMNLVKIPHVAKTEGIGFLYSYKDNYIYSLRPRSLSDQVTENEKEYIYKLNRLDEKAKPTEIASYSVKDYIDFIGFAE